MGERKTLIVLGSVLVLIFLFQNAQTQSVLDTGVDVGSVGGFFDSIGGTGQVLFGLIVLLLLFAFTFFPKEKS